MSYLSFKFVASNAIRPSIILSNYSSELTIEYETFYHPEGYSSGHHYEVIQIIVHTTGTYSFTCVSNMDTYGYIYNGTFTQLTYEPRNIIDRNDDMGENGQFKVTALLQADLIYTLIVTTYMAGVTGPFSIIALGLDNIHFIRMNIPRTTTSSMISKYRLFSDHIFI